MGLLDSLESMAANQMEQSGNPTAKVAGGLMSALETHPGGLGGLMNTMQQNGVDTQAVASGGAVPPNMIEQGLEGSGLIESIAGKTGMSPDAIKSGLATALPMVMSHFTEGGTTAPPEGGLAGMASQILGKFL
jgi:uncharacterized protein YidB (DUF937 family)